MSEPMGAEKNGTIDWPREWDQHQSWLRAVVAARSGELQAVDEILQEVALAAIGQRAKPTDPAKVAPWLYQVAVRQSLMYRRKHGRRRKFVERFAEYADQNPPHSAPREPIDTLLADERESMVRECLKRLKPRDAEILMLKYTQDWSYSKIARRLGVSESAVESRLHRARGRLRQELKNSRFIETNP